MCENMRKIIYAQVKIEDISSLILEKIWSLKELDQVYI